MHGTESNTFVFVLNHNLNFNEIDCVIFKEQKNMRVGLNMKEIGKMEHSMDKVIFYFTCKDII